MKKYAPTGSNALRAAAFVGAMLVSGATLGSENITLPDIGDSSGAVVSQQAEAAYGEALMREFRRLAHIVDDPIVEDYIRHMGFSLVAVSDQPAREFTFFVVDDDNVNAFAAPGGYIGVHSELILTADNESELAAVMAHEVAHVTQRHIARAIEARQKSSLPMTLLMLGALIAGASAGSDDAIQGAVVGSQALAAQMQINFTRGNEYEADRVGIHVLAAAGYDPQGMPDFFSKMARLSRGVGDQIPEFLRTHPVETSRIAESKDRALNIQVADRDHDPLDFMLIRERLRVLTADRAEDLLVYYQREGVDELHEAYGMALVQLESSDPVGAMETMGPFMKDAPRKLPLQLLEAEARLQLDGETQAFEELMDYYPSSRVVASRYGELLLRQPGDAAARRVEKLLRPLLARFPEDARLHLTYSRAADRAGFPIRAAEAHAQHVFLLGRVYDAVTQLRNLLDTPGLNYYERSRIEARLAEFEPILAEIELNDGYDPSEGKDERERRG